jgi:hypothetical protein
LGPDGLVSGRQVNLSSWGYIGSDNAPIATDVVAIPFDFDTAAAVGPQLINTPSFDYSSAAGQTMVNQFDTVRLDSALGGFSAGSVVMYVGATPIVDANVGQDGISLDLSDTATYEIAEYSDKTRIALDQTQQVLDTFSDRATFLLAEISLNFSEAYELIQLQIYIPFLTAQVERLTELKISVWQKVEPLTLDVVKDGDQYYRFMGDSDSVDLSNEDFSGPRWSPITNADQLLQPGLSATAFGDINIVEKGLDDLPINVISTNGNVNLATGGSISVAHTGSSTSNWAQGSIRGADVTIDAGAGLASIDQPLSVHATGIDGLSIKAIGDVFIKDVIGDLRLNKLDTTGVAWISVTNGALIDTNSEATRDDRAYEELANGVWKNLQLTNYTRETVEDPLTGEVTYTGNMVYTGYADEKIASVIETFKIGKEAEYQTYWLFDDIAAANDDVVKLSAAEVLAYTAYYQGLGKTGSEIATALATLENSRTIQYGVLKAKFAA